MRAAPLFAAVSVTAGCGSDGVSSQPAERSEGELTSARFTDRTTYWFGGESITSRTRGAFDWESRRGFAVETGLAGREHLIQLGDTCYRRFGQAPWRSSRATDVDGLCDAARFENPATIDDLMAQVADDWREVERASVRGVPTTRYSGTLAIGAVRGPLELWVDDDGFVRRLRQAGEEAESYVTVREYFDFGVDVRVRRPTTGGSR